MPDRSDRVVVDVGDGDWLAELRERTVCLVRTGRGAECMQPGGHPAACDPRLPEQVAAELAPVFDSMPRVTLPSAFQVNQQLQRLFPTGTPTQAVLDARRDVACRDWQDGRACAAVRVGALAFLFTRLDAGPGPVQRIEAFRVAQTCTGELSP